MSYAASAKAMDPFNCIHLLIDHPSNYNPFQGQFYQDKRDQRGLSGQTLKFLEYITLSRYKEPTIFLPKFIVGENQLIYWPKQLTAKQIILLKPANSISFTTIHLPTRNSITLKTIHLPTRNSITFTAMHPPTRNSINKK